MQLTRFFEVSRERYSNLKSWPWKLLGRVGKQKFEPNCPENPESVETQFKEVKTR